MTLLFLGLPSDCSGLWFFPKLGISLILDLPTLEVEGTTLPRNVGSRSQNKISQLYRCGSLTPLNSFISAVLPCHISLNGYNSSSHSPTHTGSLMLGQEGLLPPGMKSPSTPLHSPTRGQLFLSDHHSDNSNDPAVTSDQEDEDDHIRADPRIDLTDHRGDPRDELRAAEEAEDRAPGSPIRPLSLTTNDKNNGKASPKCISEVS